MGWWFNNSDGNNDKDSNNQSMFNFNSTSSFKQISCAEDPKDQKFIVCTQKTISKINNPDGTTSDTTDERVFQVQKNNQQQMSQMMGFNMFPFLFDQSQSQQKAMNNFNSFFTPMKFPNDFFNLPSNIPNGFNSQRMPQTQPHKLPVQQNQKNSTKIYDL